MLKDDWNLFVPSTVNGLMPTNNIEGVVNNPPPPAIESINEANIDMRKRKKYIKFVSWDISIIYSVTSLLNWYYN